MHADPAEAIRMRLEQLQQNVDAIGQNVDEMLKQFEDAEQKKLRRQMMLQRLIRTIAEVGLPS